MSHREREIVPDGGTNETEGSLTMKCFVSVCNTKYAGISREAENV